MATTTTTTNMALVIPIPLAEIGPQWAQDLVTAFNRIDAHTHQTGNGIPITPLGMNINSDLSVGGNNTTNHRTARFTVQGSNPSLGADVACLYAGPTGDLWYNNSSGTQIRMTASGAVNSVTSITPLVLASRTVSSTYTIDSITSDVMLFLDSSGSAFNVTMPTPTAGRSLTLIDLKSAFATNPVTLVPHAGEKIAGVNGNKVLTAAGAIYQAYSNGTDWFVAGA